MGSIARHSRADSRERSHSHPFHTGATQGRPSVVLPSIRTVLGPDIFPEPSMIHERPFIAQEYGEAERILSTPSSSSSRSENSFARYSSDSFDDSRNHYRDYGRIPPISRSSLPLPPPPPPPTRSRYCNEYPSILFTPSSSQSDHSACHDSEFLDDSIGSNGRLSSVSPPPSSQCSSASARNVEEYPPYLERKDLDFIPGDTLTPFRNAPSSDTVGRLIYFPQDRLETAPRAPTPTQSSTSSITSKRRRQHKKLPRPHRKGCKCYVPGGGFPTWKAMLTHVIRSSEQGKLTLSEIRSELQKQFPCLSDSLPRHDNTIRQTLSSQRCFNILPSSQHRKNHQWYIKPDEHSNPA